MWGEDKEEEMAKTMAVNGKDLENRVHEFCSNHHRSWNRAIHRKDALYSSLSIQKHELIALLIVMKTTKQDS